MKTLLSLLGVLLLGSAFIINATTPVMATGYTPVGPAGGADADGNPSDPTVVEDTVGAPSKLVCIDIKNDTKKDWTDVHLENVQYYENNDWHEAKFDETYNGGTGIQVSTIDGGAGSAMGGLPGNDESEIGASTHAQGGGQGTLGKGKSIKVCFKPLNLNDKALDAGTKVRVDVTGTEGADENNPAGNYVSATDVNEIGDGAPRTLVSSLGIPSFTSGAASGSVSAGTLTLNDITLAETCDYRFNTGSMVVKPNRSTRFAIDPDNTEVLIYNENGQVAGGGVAGAGNLRINDAGALVMDILRDQTDDLHVVIVIRGLELESFDHLEVGDEVRAGAYGEAVPAGGVLTEIWKIAEFDAS